MSPPDPRAWQHGIQLVRTGGRLLLVWSSWGNPPAPVPRAEHWQHDIYYGWIDPQRPAVDARTLISMPEAQEPASAAVNAGGQLLVTCEDGQNAADVVDQNAGLYGPDLAPIQPYPLQVGAGGHSGHVAALGSDFLVTFGREWVDGGGVNNLGTGRDVLARVIHADGAQEGEIPVSVNPDAAERDWWPVVTASRRNWLVVWQRYGGEPGDGGGELWGAIIDPSGAVTSRFPITDDILYYHYNVTYAPDLNRYVVFGSKQDGGFVCLLDTDGNTIDESDNLPPTVREGTLVIGPASRVGQVEAVYPARPSGVAVLGLTRGTVTLKRLQHHPYGWEPMGTDGVFLDPHTVLFASLSHKGVRLLHVRLRD